MFVAGFDGENRRGDSREVQGRQPWKARQGSRTVDTLSRKVRATERVSLSLKKQQQGEMRRQKLILYSPRFSDDKLQKPERGERGERG